MGGVEKVKAQYAKSRGRVAKVIKLIPKTDECLRSLSTTLQFWTSEAKISSYFFTDGN